MKLQCLWCRGVTSEQVGAALTSLVASGKPLADRYVVEEGAKRSTGSHGLVVHAHIKNLQVPLNPSNPSRNKNKYTGNQDLSNNSHVVHSNFIILIGPVTSVSTRDSD